MQTDPTGSWRGTVTRPDAVEPNALTLRPDGTLLLTAGDDGHGGAGEGSWRTPAPGELAWTCHEVLRGPDGAPFGHVEIDQRGTVDATTLATSGVSRVFGTDGALRYEVEVRVDAAREA